MSVTLITIIHDPTGEQIPLFREVASRFSKIYTQCYITLSDQTKPQWITELASYHFNVKVIPKRGAAHARRQVVKFGLESKDDSFHYCDFDRLLTWVSKFPDELHEVVQEIPQTDYWIFGRTPRAFATHPIHWQETEKVTNKVFSLEFGREVDITAGSCAFSRLCAQAIDAHSEAEMTDAEWPMIIHRQTPHIVTSRLVEGLEFVTAINDSVSDRSEAEKWLGRIRLCHIISQSAISTGKEYT